jgi:hypothetical protein
LEGYNHSLVEGTAVAFTEDTEEKHKEHLRLNDGMDTACSMHGDGGHEYSFAQ